MILRRISTGPNAQLELTGRLRETFPTVRVLVRERAHERAVEIPFQLVFAPIGGVVVEIGLWGRRRRKPFGAGDGVGGVAFAVVIGFRVGGVGANDFPVDLVEVVGLEDYAADDLKEG